MKGILEIYKASAGSGKTHTLAHKYIDILLGANADTESYKHILAVTFTNKATEEMKSRIVSILYNLSQGSGKELEGLSAADAAKVSARAKTILTAILHDYSNFQVTTIDKFFQQIFRSFARELGRFSNYRVELSDEDVLSHAIDDMLSSLDDASTHDAEKIYKVINGFALDQWRYNSKSKYTEQLLDFAKLFIKEDFKKKAGDYESDADKTDVVGKAAADYVDWFEKELSGAAREALVAIAEQGLSLDDFRGGQKGAMQKLPDYAKGGMPLLTAGQKEMFTAGPEGWFAAKNLKTMQPRAMAACSRGDKPGLDALLGKIVDLFGEPYAKYRTALIIRNNLGVMKIFGGIYDALGKYLKENNLMLLGETTDALHTMIGASDTPFIYERIGSWIDHYLLDEFQDFSLMQWDNFKPLLEQSLDAGGDNLIVGDVKQSIYRWRGSDWNTLESGIDSDLDGKNLRHETLLRNYRSDKAIVEFNNGFFETITRQGGGSFDGDGTVAMVYSDCRQESVSKGGGHVKVTFYEGKEEENGEVPSLALLKGEISRLDSRGYPRSDIYVLVRTNKEAAAAAARLIADGIDVITDESLVVGSSGYVQRIVAVLNYMVNPDDAVNAQIIKEIGLDVELVDLSGNSLYDICENIVRSIGEELLEGQMPYLMAFMDVVLDYMRDNGSDIAGFVRWWEETGCKQVISAPKGANAVRIMTIHKAKGLGCPAVIMPFFHEPLTPYHTNYMWCDDKDGFDAGIMPVEFKKEVEESTFRDYYGQEALFYKMDALNTAYVAFTRAEHELVIFANVGGRKKGISNMLWDYLAGKMEGNIFEVGEPELYKANAGDSMGSLKLDGYNSIPMEGTGSRKRLGLVYRGSDFFNPEGRWSARERGIVLHDILSRINAPEDIPWAVSQAVASGELSAAEAVGTGALVERMVASAAPYGWFATGVEVFNELSIIDTDGKVHRPDRVVIDGQKVSVIDYKFGAHHAGYRRQVMQYMEMLRQMGYRQVEGYLWYAAEDNIEKVA
ncbi:MAG: UvrD-helicase domain-containing protein [Bacteroidales bacterium]|nr:UvrD-helicase domain-containing protein [Bacteroidales bacterium]